MFCVNAFDAMNTLDFWSRCWLLAYPGCIQLRCGLFWWTLHICRNPCMKHLNTLDRYFTNIDVLIAYIFSNISYFLGVYIYIYIQINDTPCATVFAFEVVILFSQGRSTLASSILVWVSDWLWPHRRWRIKKSKNVPRLREWCCYNLLLFCFKLLIL